MRVLGLQMTLSCLLLGGCEPYKAPCHVSARNRVLQGGGFQLQRLDPDRIAALRGPGAIPVDCSTPDECLDAYQRAARSVAIVVLTTAGEILESHTIELPAAAVSSSSVERVLRAPLWTGQGVGLLQLGTEDLSPDENGQHERSFLTYQHVDLDSVATTPIELSDTSCVDCRISVAAQFFGDHAVVLFAQSSISLDQSVVPTPWRFLSLNVTGEVRASGILEWIVPGSFVAFEVAQHGDGLVVSTGGEAWLVDANLMPLAGPVADNGGYEFGSAGSGGAAIDWNFNVDVAAISWMEEGSVMLMRTNVVGDTVGSVQRLSSGGTVDAVFVTAKFVASVFSDQGSEYVAVTTLDAKKVGGDVTLMDDVVVSTPPVLAETPEGDLAIFTTTGSALERSEVSCEP